MHHNYRQVTVAFASHSKRSVESKMTVTRGVDILDKKTNLLLFVTVLSLAAFACNFVLPQTEPTPVSTQTLVATEIMEPGSTQPSRSLPLTEAEVPRVSVEEAKAALDSGAALIVDVRSAEAYEASHIPGAINIPLGEFETNPTDLKLDKEQWIITYCT